MGGTTGIIIMIRTITIPQFMSITAADLIIIQVDGTPGTTIIMITVAAVVETGTTPDLRPENSGLTGLQALGLEEVLVDISQIAVPGVEMILMALQSMPL